MTIPAVVPTAETLNAASLAEASAISLILPAFNEEAGIVDAVVEAERALQELCSHYEVIVVDDGSLDQTHALLRKAFDNNPKIKIKRHVHNVGYGGALRTGFLAARHPLIAFTDADRQFYVEDLALLAEEIANHDVVSGYRIRRNDPRIRLFYSKVYNVLVRSLLGVQIRDCDCALKLFRRSALSQIAIETNGFLVNAEILSKLRAAGASIAEVGVRHRPRTAGDSTVTFGHALPVLVALVRFVASRTKGTRPKVSAPVSANRDA